MRTNIQTFLHLLTGQARPAATFVTMRKGEPGKPMYNVKLANALHTLLALNKTGSDIFVTVNETDGTGRRWENVTAARCVFADYDAGVPTDWALWPSMIVESSPGKAQAYWLLCERVEPRERWHAAERGVVWATGADRNVCDAARILRVPCMINWKYPERPVTRLIEANGNRFSLGQIEAAWPPVAAPVASMAAGCAVSPADEEKARRYGLYLAATEPELSTSGRLCVGRNWLFRKAAMGVRDFDLPVGIVAELLCERLPELSFTDALQFAQDADRYSTGTRGAAYVRLKPGQVVMQ